MKYLDEEISNFLFLAKDYGLVESQITSEHTKGGKFIQCNDLEVIDLTRMDYLALGEDKTIRKFMSDSIYSHDISCPASQFVFKPGAIRMLEKKISAWHGLEDSLIFTNGYSANINVMQALGMRLRSPHLSVYAKSLRLGKATRHIPTVFIIDTNSHYSLVHGVRIACKLSSHCHAFNYTAGNTEQLEKIFKKVADKFGDDAVKIIVSDTLVSSTGKYIDLKPLFEAATKHDCLLYLDEAHAVGAVGKKGAGVASMQVPEDYDTKRLIIMGTLTKAFSQLGGYVSFGDEKILALVRACCPQYIFSAPILPWMADTLEKTLELISGEWGNKKRKKLKDNSDYLRQQLSNNNINTLGSQSHIIPVLIGDEVKCMSLRLALVDEGFNVASFFFPSVPKNESILRISMSADIERDEIDLLVTKIVEYLTSGLE